MGGGGDGSGRAAGRLDRWVRAGEARLGRLPLAAGVALGLMALAALSVRPGSEPVELGRLYAALSLDPLAFDRDNPVGFRILTPLLSWALGLRGDAIRWTNLGLATLLLGVAFAGFRRRSPRPGDALLLAASLAFSLVTLSTLFSPSYCDPATYLAVLGMWWCRERRVAFFALFFLGLLNRESIAFLVPWFAFVELSQSDRKLRSAAVQLAGYGLVFAVYFGFRAFVASRAEVAFDLAYYLGPLRDDPLHYLRMTAGRQAIGAFSVFGWLWAIPLAAVFAMGRRGDRRGVASLAVLAAVTWSQLVFAYDTSRLLTLGFVAMVVAFEDLCDHDALRFRAWVPWLLLLQWVTPHVRTAQQRVWFMDSLFSGP
jgi:hypothetical protein